MQGVNPERKQYSIVLIGLFNPLMFQPEWFGKNDVISTEDAEFARSQDNSLPTIITPQLTLFRTSQLSITVEPNRFQVVAEKEPMITIKDFTKKTFEKLGGLTIKAYGFNFSAHYRFENEIKINAFADKLTPKQYWESLLGKDISGENRKGGLSLLQMSQEKENGKGQIFVALQRSVHITHGIFLTCNDHTNIDEGDSAADIVMEMIESDFGTSFENMTKIQKGIIAEASKNE